MEIYIKREVRLFTLRYILLVTIVCIGCVAMIYQCETLSSLKDQYGSYHIQPPVHAEYEHKIPCDKKIQPEGKKNNHISLSCNSNSQLHKQTDYYPWDKEPQATHIPTIEVLDSKIADTRVMTGGRNLLTAAIHIHIHIPERVDYAC